MLLQSIVQHGYNHNSNSATDQNSWAKTAQAPLSFQEHCSQSIKLHSCACSCPTYQLGAHKNTSLQAPKLRHSLLYSQAKSATTPHQQGCTQWDSVQRMELSEGRIFTAGSNKPVQLQHILPVPGNKANKPFILTLQLLFQIIYLNIVGYFAYIKSCSKCVPKISGKSRST